MTGIANSTHQRAERVRGFARDAVWRLRGARTCLFLTHATRSFYAAIAGKKLITWIGWPGTWKANCLDVNDRAAGEGRGSQNCNTRIGGPPLRRAALLCAISRSCDRAGF